MPGIFETQLDSGSPLRVVITPSQSSFFAGEQFSVTITFTNVRSPEAGTSKSHSERANTQTRTHKRGAHSISSAPLAQPPTSPGTPRTLSNFSSQKLNGYNGGELPRRRGLIGTTKIGCQDAHLPQLIEQRGKRIQAKALSISISPQELEEQAGERARAVAPVSAPSYQQSYFDTRQLPASSPVPSPLSRTDALALSSHHPHARKVSIFDGQLSLDVLSPTTSLSLPPQSTTPTGPSLSLTTISESSSPEHALLVSLSTPRTPPHLSSTSHVMQAYPSVTPTTATLPSRAMMHAHNQQFSQQAHLGLGQPQSQIRMPQRNAYSATYPWTSSKQSSNELILYSYAQLVGTVLITPEGAGTAVPTQEQRAHMDKIRRALLRRRVALGGGSMDISRSLHNIPSMNLSVIGGNSSHHTKYPRIPGYLRRKGHRRSLSLSSSLMSLLSPTLETMSARATTTPPSHLNGKAIAATDRMPIHHSGPGNGTGSGLHIMNQSSLGGEILEEIDPELPLPTFEAQPSMVAVDLSLSPGESRSYIYAIQLPDVLPPTYKGRALQFSYELVVGTCRAGTPISATRSPEGTRADSISRVMKVPIRVYNHVAVDRSPRPYDMLWPVSRNQLPLPEKGKDKGIPETQGNVVEASGLMTERAVHLSPRTQGSLEDLRKYTKRLVSSLSPVLTGNRTDRPQLLQSAADIRSETSSSPSPSDVDGGPKNPGLRMSMDGTREEEEDRTMVGCREAVEILTRLPKKASYDVNKDGVKVAVLTFSKSAYRLGETVSGIVELNDRMGRARVLQLCAILEAHETLPISVAPLSSARSLKRAYAEHYASFTINTLRTTFALDIPSDASPAFQIKMDHVESCPQIRTPVSQGGLEWKVRLCLLVAIASETSDPGTEDVLFRSLKRDGLRGAWGSSWRAPKSLAPLEKSKTGDEKMKSRSWTQLLYDSVWNTVSSVGAEDGNQHHDGDGSDVEDGISDERGYDGIKPDLAGGVGVGVDFAGGERGWNEVKLETVECEVPIRVWPGNTAFRALDVVFDV